MSAPLGKTIRIYLADGTPTGIRHAELVNWTIQALVCPRARVPALSAWPEARRPGTYLLVGEDGDGPLAYIGESENVFKRLQNHLAQKDFWRQVVFVTSKDDNLTKAHVKYIESRFQALAEDAKRIRLSKGKGSDEPNLPKPDRDAMEEYIQSARILLGALGFPYLEKLTQRAPPPNDASTPVAGGGDLIGRELRFTVKKRGVDGTGTMTDEGFVVFAGSVGSAQLTSSMPPGWRDQREAAITAGDITLTSSGTTFAKDVLFSSSSAAAAVLAGTNRNGRVSWRTSDGQTLKDLEEALSGVDDPEGSPDEVSEDEE